MSNVQRFVAQHGYEYKNVGDYVLVKIYLDMKGEIFTITPVHTVLEAYALFGY